MSVTSSAYDVILFGINRIGHTFLEQFRESNYSLLAIDHDPVIIEKLDNQGIATQYTDANDINALETIPFVTSNIVISTIPHYETNILILTTARTANPHTVCIAVASRINEALELYKHGFDYVILPHFLGASHAAEVVLDLKSNKEAYRSLQVKHIKNLNLHIEAGHEHP
jgi:Trk K+ transport system NAD-binding subunit